MWWRGNSSVPDSTQRLGMHALCNEWDSCLHLCSLESSVSNTASLLQFTNQSAQTSDGESRRTSFGNGNTTDQSIVIFRLWKCPSHYLSLANRLDLQECCLASWHTFICISRLLQSILIKEECQQKPWPHREALWSQKSQLHLSCDTFQLCHVEPIKLPHLLPWASW